MGKNLDHYEISGPLGFYKREFKGWDPISQTFNHNEIPNEIKSLLKKAGLRKKDLKKKDTALLVFEILLKETDCYSLINNSKSL